MAKSRSKTKPKKGGKKSTAKANVKTMVKKAPIKMGHGDGAVISFKTIATAQATKKK